MTLAPTVSISGAELVAMHHGAHTVRVPSAVVRVEGTGALQCIQGVFTNDVVAGGDTALTWGGVLTAKGMIVFDMWVWRDGANAWLIVPMSAYDAAAALFKRTFPPRIAKVTDHTSTHHVHWLLGDHVPAGESVARPAGPAPFAALHLGESLVPQGLPVEIVPAPANWVDAAMLLNGWPVVGREIDARTLPQEVRFDELGGVRYDKGCYTGQETVARLHFRGHPNRTLRGLRWHDGATPSSSEIVHGDKTVGTIATWGQIGDAALGTAKIRREVETGADVSAGNAVARVIDLPFDAA